MTTTTSALGGAVRRREDPALIQGEGIYADDVTPHGTSYAAFTRSPFAHAKINSIDTSAAEAAEGVVAVYTHDDVAHLGDLIAQVVVVRGRPLLAGSEVGDWVEWHPEGSSPASYRSGLGPSHELHRYTDFGDGWYLVRYGR